MSTPEDPHSQPEDQSFQQQQQPTIQNRLPVHTHHCRFCNHLLLATTRDISSLPRRKDPAQDKAIILPLPTSSTAEDSDPNQQEHYTILLSTTVPDRKATLVRREDGFEKRLFLRCGRCRVVVGYFLDGVLFPMTSVAASASRDDGEAEEGERKEKVVYLLPGALVETGFMGDEGRLKGVDDEWRGWRAEV